MYVGSGYLASIEGSILINLMSSGEPGVHLTRAKLRLFDDYPKPMLTFYASTRSDVIILKKAFSKVWCV
jgi:hypothetical protein